MYSLQISFPQRSSSLTRLNTGHPAGSGDHPHSLHNLLKLWTVGVSKGLDEESSHRQTIGFIGRLRESLVLGIEMHGMCLHRVPSSLHRMLRSRAVVVRPVKVQLLKNVLLVAQWTSVDVRMDCLLGERNVGGRTRVNDRGDSLVREVAIVDERAKDRALGHCPRTELDGALNGHLFV